MVENRPGAAMQHRHRIGRKRRPDGYTLLNITTINAWNATIYQNLDFNFIRDIAPVAEHEPHRRRARSPSVGAG